MNYELIYRVNIRNKDIGVGYKLLATNFLRRRQMTEQTIMMTMVRAPPEAAAAAMTTVILIVVWSVQKIIFYIFLI